ncbi:hypothetical protein [Streptomyces sp. NPDC057280]|uniref:hypothetical protein n=1 Tax=Streptomyces sp. NPDC057280 TaxID=3346081 RepID=UPI0036350F95
MAAIELQLHTDDPNENAALHAYWQLAEDGETWAQSVSAVRSQFGLTQRDMQRLVQEGATALLHNVRCAECGEPHEATSRTNYAELVRQGNVLCPACQGIAQQVRKQAAQERSARRRKALSEVFPVHAVPPIEVGDLTLFQAVALHALFSDPAVEDAGLTTPTDSWPKERRWAPASLRWDYERRLLHAKNRTLILAHQDSRGDAFVWEDDQPTGSFYLGKVSYYLLGPEEDLPARTPRLLTGLNQVFREGPWPSSWLAQWRELWEELALAHASAYLDMKLAEHHLEMKQGDGTRTTLADALADFSLGQVCNFIYRATKDSAAYYQRGGVNKQQAANSTISRISTNADRARANGWDVKSFALPWNLPFSAISETFFNKVMRQADMMQTPLDEAHPPTHAWPEENEEPPTDLDVPADTPATGRGEKPETVTAEAPGIVDVSGADSSSPGQRFALLLENGELRFNRAPFPDIRGMVVPHGGGETGLEWLPGHHPLALYYFVPYLGPDDRPVNKTANGMFWELSEPPLPGPDEEPPDDPYSPEDRIIEVRGTVAFLCPGEQNLTDEHETALREAHHWVTRRLHDSP